ncbi:MAG: hypothetical protein A3F33_01935 [Candidatus Woykebacteria bacterium RIFCSPHIGHO2_12_FULL_43_10]|uniref:Uncharacterized protein n=2 Tax=Candidatus Woykeibacteriota TaxID=1817899 RepID=A0A1G1WVV3_9BACT|nr:MAG: hypothetical protein A3J50_01465 [Candidatus Woykebacteria bacterium RIFCSPHIGHO2_02_FULL_43_16b]OGY30306.1 MAG: hypothetical protein A3F33_01935 [Candidatus Woykebacteria bacterium RIFCSPHIGHO2_12_FULL_43_10]OGY31834.1 MAG: hypothetical protein A3A61_02455 [Candidatus Woykebacteria bacterium RIFCSPLOWO2_01_FULL_43_14]
MKTSVSGGTFRDFLITFEVEVKKDGDGEASSPEIETHQLRFQVTPNRDLSDFERLVLISYPGARNISHQPIGAVA